jgi:hypothetical protein
LRLRESVECGPRSSLPALPLPERQQLLTRALTDDEAAMLEAPYTLRYDFE